MSVSQNPNLATRATFDNPIPVIALIGPTAVGKTALSLELARKLKAEVISADSRQIYRYMDVGTDKISLEIRREILHHMIDLRDPDEIFSASDFVSEAHRCIQRIRSRGRVPLFVGGTPFYYQALFSGLLSIDVPTDENMRRSLMELEPEELHRRLALVDPQSASRLHPNDRFRVSRALEIYNMTGRTATELYEDPSLRKKSPYDVLYIGLIRPREKLLTIIERRVREQFASGYPEEVRWLLDHGYSPTLPSMQGFGYRELVLFHQGKLSLEEAIQGDIVATRQFAKRQMTWFRKFPSVLWFDLSQESIDSVLQKAEAVALDHLERRGA